MNNRILLIGATSLLAAAAQSSPLPPFNPPTINIRFTRPEPQPRRERENNNTNNNGSGRQQSQPTYHAPRQNRPARQETHAIGAAMKGHPHVFYTDAQGHVQPESGFTWASDRPGDFRVKSIPGALHP